MKVVVSLIVVKEEGKLDLVVGERRLNKGDKEVISKFEGEEVVCVLGNSRGRDSEVRKLMMKLKEDNSEFEYKGWLKGFNRIENEIEKCLLKGGVVKLVRWSVEYDDCISVVVM